MLLKSEDDVPRALAKDRQTLGGRWLEVYKASRSELFRATGSVAALRPDAGFEGVVVASGLPFRLSPKDLVEFFRGYEVARNGVCVPSRLPRRILCPSASRVALWCGAVGRFIINHPSGRPSGDAYIVFRNADDAKAAVRALVRRHTPYVDVRLGPGDRSPVGVVAACRMVRPWTVAMSRCGV